MSRDLLVWRMAGKIGAILAHAKKHEVCAPCFLITARVDVSTLALNAGIKFSHRVFKMYTNFGNLLKFK